MHRFSLRWRSLGCLVLLGLLLSLGWSYWRQPTAAPAIDLIAPLPQDPLIQVYFNHAQSAAYQDPDRLHTRLGDNLEQVILEAIASSQRSIDLAVQELNLPRVAQALVERQQAGIAVRVIVENSYHRPLSSFTAAEVSQLEERGQKKHQEFRQLADRDQDGQFSPAEVMQFDAIAILQAAGVPIVDDTEDGSKGSGLMHHKFIVIDQRSVILGSANFTWSDIHGDFSVPESLGNANHLLKIESRTVANWFAEEFAILWGDGVGQRSNSRFGKQKPYRSPQVARLGSQSRITVQFSPTSARIPWQQSVNGLIAQTLSRARQSIDLALFVFSDQPLGDVMQPLAQRGVKIRALIDAQFAFRDYSEGLDLLGVAIVSPRCQIEPGNRPWAVPLTTVGVPSLPTGDLLHHKFGLLDRQTVITGSHNWSIAANTNNDEALLVIENPVVAAHFQREFDRLYQTARLGIPESVRQTAQNRAQQCGA